MTKINTRGLYRTGGPVVGVPNAPDRPEERINKYTGVPYDLEAGPTAQPEKDRKGFSEEGKLLATLQRRQKKFTGGKETDNSLRYKKIFNELPESLKQDKHIINVDGSDYVVDKKVTAEDFKKRLSDFGTPQAYISGLEAKMKRLLEKEEGPLEKVGRDATNFLSFLTNALNPRTTINDIRYINAPYFSEREKEMLKDYKKSKEKIMYKYFSEDELKCRHTGQCDMDWAFMQTIERIRERCGFPFKVSSAYRSIEHPIEAAKDNPGAHTTGKAMDILVSGEQAMTLIKIAIEEGINRIGVAQKGDRASRFIHLDMDNSRATPRVWSY